VPARWNHCQTQGHCRFRVFPLRLAARPSKQHRAILVSGFRISVITFSKPSLWLRASSGRIHAILPRRNTCARCRMLTWYLVGVPVLWKQSHLRSDWLFQVLRRRVSRVHRRSFYRGRVLPGEILVILFGMWYSDKEVLLHNVIDVVPTCSQIDL
jgi:hypothetical protein